MVIKGSPTFYSFTLDMIVRLDMINHASQVIMDRNNPLLLWSDAHVFNHCVQGVRTIATM